MDSPRGVEAVERATRLLACFEAAGETLSLAQLAQRSRLYKSTILRLATSLQRIRVSATLRKRAVLTWGGASSSRRARPGNRGA